jgi:pseudouridine synthase
MEVRLNRYLADQGIASRRKADELIAAGRVWVNGKVATVGAKIDAHADQVVVDEAVLEEQKELIYLLLNKPAGCVTSNKATSTEPHIVMDLIPKELPVYPVGRLDKETTGLLLLTNDGVLAYRLTHPSWDCEKEYEATLSQPLTAERLRKLEAGVRLDRTGTKPTSVTPLGARRARIVLTEGRNRQVRRIFGKVGCEVKRLKRIRIKALVLDETAVPLGQFRHLTASEVKMLRDA